MEQEQSNPKKQERKKKTLIFILTTLLVAVIIITIILIASRTKSDETNIDPRSFEEIFWDSETAEEAIATFQKKIDQTNDIEQQAQFYLERADFLFEMPRNEVGHLFQNQIISDATKSDKINPTPETAGKISNYYRIFNMYEESQNYMNIFYERVANENEK